jgi:hypothetical protein
MTSTSRDRSRSSWRGDIQETTYYSTEETVRAEWWLPPTDHVLNMFSLHWCLTAGTHDLHLAMTTLHSFSSGQPASIPR